MISQDPMAVRMIAALIRMVVWPLRGFLAAVGVDPAATTAVGGLILAAALSMPLVAKTAVCTKQRIGRRMTARRCRRQFNAIIDDHPELFPSADQPGHLPDLVLLDDAPPLRREIKRRRGVRIPRRPMRRPTSTNSDRRLP